MFIFYQTKFNMAFLYLFAFTSHLLIFILIYSKIGMIYIHLYIQFIVRLGQIQIIAKIITKIIIIIK